MPTKKFAIQLMLTASDVAAGRADWLNSSDTRNQGIDPGPVANNIINATTSKMHM